MHHVALKTGYPGKTTPGLERLHTLSTWSRNYTKKAPCSLCHVLLSIFLCPSHSPSQTTRRLKLLVYRVEAGSSMTVMDHDNEKAHVEHTAVYAEKADVADYKADAIEAENAEHNMTVLQAVRAYPMASFWAFIISCTIVGSSAHQL